jgi:hypothetical protein
MDRESPQADEEVEIPELFSPLSTKVSASALSSKPAAYP